MALTASDACIIAQRLMQTRELSKDAKIIFEFMANGVHLYPEQLQLRYYLGVCYLYGIGIDKNEANGITIIKYCADNGFALAQLEYGNCLKNGTGIQKDDNQASQYYLMSANQNCCYAMCILAYDLINSTSPIDQEKGVIWYTKASDLGNANAQYNLGCCFLQGLHVSVDAPKAVDLFTKSAQQNNEHACFALGQCFEDGVGINQDMQIALQLYSKASKLGHEGAKQALWDMLIDTYDTLVH